MLMARYPQPTAQAAYLDDSSPNLGAIYENVIAQELTAQGIPLYYYMAKKHGEVDFIADTNADSVMPFEVKSGRSYRTHAAIDAVLANAEYRISQGVVLSRSNIAQDGGNNLSSAVCHVLLARCLQSGLTLDRQHHRRLFADGAPRVGFASVRALPLRAQGVEGVIEARAKPGGPRRHRSWPRAPAVRESA